MLFTIKNNLLYIILLVIGGLLLLLNFFIKIDPISDIIVGLGTGIITSTIVSVLIERINNKQQEKRDIRLKSQIILPLYELVINHMEAYNKKILVQTLLNDESQLNVIANKKSILEKIPPECNQALNIGNLLFSSDEIDTLLMIKKLADELLNYCKFEFQGLQYWDILMNDNLISNPYINIEAYNQEQHEYNLLNKSQQKAFVDFSKCCSQYVQAIRNFSAWYKEI